MSTDESPPARTWIVPDVSLARREAVSGRGLRKRNRHLTDAAWKFRRKKNKKWDRKLIGVIPFYPRSQEAWDKRIARGKELFARLRAEGRLPNRRGIPGGFGRRKDLLDPARAAAAASAKVIVTNMKKQGLIEGEDPRGEEALESVVAVIRANVADPNTGETVHLYGVRERLNAAKIVLEYTKAKPASKQDVTIRNAESFLDELAADTE